MPGVLADALSRDPSLRALLARPAGNDQYVVERAKELGVLLSTDGPDRNVIKIKPPMPFSQQDADRLAATLDTVLAEEPVLRLLAEGA